ncbi:MAG: MFS transporter [Lentisphaeria bacterium]|nr:MFS transporter [Lentisphaeria bacterium]
MNGYPYWKMNLAMLWISQLIILAGFQALGPFIPLYMEEVLGITSKKDLAVNVAEFHFFGTLAYCIFNPIWGRLSDRFGAKLMLLRGTFVTAFLFPLMGYVKSVEMFIFLRFLTAACAGTTAISNMMIVRNTPNERQGFALGLLATAIWGGSMLGNVCCGLIIHYLGYRESFWICGIMYFLAGFAVLFTRDDAVKYVPPPPKEKKSFNWKAILPQLSRQIWIILGLFIVIGFIRYFEIPYIAMKIKDIVGAKTADYWTGIISAFVCLGAVISGAGIGYLSDRFPAKKLLFPIFILSAVGLVMQGGAHGLWTFGIGRVLLYIAAGGLPSVIQKILATITPQEKRGSAFGLASTFNGIGILLATCASSTTLILIGCDGVFYVTAALFLIAMPFSFLCVSKAMKLQESKSVKNI